jgi:Tfp pilus assembly protein PilW
MKGVISRGAVAFTLIEILISATIGLLVLGGVLSGALTMQRCFVAAEDFAVAKSDQARLSDYIALDLRRALSVTPGKDGTTIMTVQIPDYYDEVGQPVTPTITNYVASYGNPAQPVTIVYQKSGSSIYRQENAAPAREIAANVQDFQLSVQDLGKVVKTQVTFAPRFQRIPTAAARAATTVFNTTLLRNKRQNP